jgi:hypothetical protein
MSGILCKIAKGFYTEVKICMLHQLFLHRLHESSEPSKGSKTLIPKMGANYFRPKAQKITPLI